MECKQGRDTFLLHSCHHMSSLEDSHTADTGSLLQLLAWPAAIVPDNRSCLCLHVQGGYDGVMTLTQLR